MKKIILAAAAVSLGILFAATGAATAQTRDTTFKPGPAVTTKLKISAEDFRSGRNSRAARQHCP